MINFLKTTKYNQQGLSTLEMLIAMTLIIITISSVLPLVSVGQSTSIDSTTNQEALYGAKDILENARATAKSDYNSVNSETFSVPGDFYQEERIVDPASITQCGKNVESHVWIGGQLTTASLLTRITDLFTAAALGGNCDNSPPPPGWNPPDTWASDDFNPGEPSGLDALNRIVYMTSNKTPYFYIADTELATSKCGSPLPSCPALFITFANNFNPGVELNDVRVARLSDGKAYAFVARNAKTNQFQIIDVNDIHNPISKGLFQLSGVSATGSYPQAWRVYYYDNKVYVTTRYTAGPELHIFDVSNPNNIYEIGSGTELGLTVNSFVATKKNIGGTWHTFIYAATSSNLKELFVLNATDPYNVLELTNASRNLDNPDYADANAVFLIGNNLYLGRDSSNPDDLYVFDTTNPLLSSNGLPILRTADIDTSVIGIVVSGPYIFVATTKSNAEFQVWTSDPTTSIVKVNINPFNFPNLTTVGNGLKYENGWVYLASQANDALRILYNNP